MVTLGYRAELDAAKRFISDIEPGDNIDLVFHGDADGCCSGAIMYRTLRQRGNQMVFPVFLEKGETIYSDTFANRALARDPAYLIVMDMGSRTRAILPGITTMIIDHHVPEGVPPVDLFVTSYDVKPHESASLLTYEICREMVQLGGLDWLAAVGTAGDIGVNADIEVLRSARSLYGVNAIREAVSLVNAARRSRTHDVATAFSALIRAESPLSFTDGTMPDMDRLREYKEEVNNEFKRVLRIGPKFSGQWALIQFSSPDLVHALVASAWTRKLSSAIVVAANYGYTPGNVHFSVRTELDTDLMQELRGVHPSGANEEFAHGHRKATGGILPLDRFQDFLEALGFPPEVATAAPGNG